MYSVKNTTTKPVRPLGIMVGVGDAADGSSCKMVSGDVPVILSDEDYAYAKTAINKYVKAGMLTCENLTEDKPDVVEDIDELREKGKELGIASWHVMGAEKLRKAIADAEAE